METTKERKLLQTIVTKAWEDADFKSALLANPVQAIESLTGEQISIPEGKRLIVRDQTDPSAVFINIPAEPDMSDMELDEEQLDIVSGGTTPPPPVITDPAVGLKGLVG